MFKEGDFIIYGSNGVCQVEHIGSMDLQGVPGDKMYYTLVPVYEEKSRLFKTVVQCSININQPTRNQSLAVSVIGL